MPIFKCRNWYLHTTERRIIKDGDFLEITPKSFDILQLLIEKKGETVTKDEILGQVWNGSFVEESNLPVHISKLRRNLGETKTEPIIETAQGIGYRFIAPIKIVEEEEWERIHSKKPFEIYNHFPKLQSHNSIAILPFNGYQKNEEIEYLADGLTEGIINQLIKNPSFKVIGRNTVFQYKGKKVNPRDIGKKLNVSFILTGRIKILNEKLIVSCELLNVLDDTQIWGEQFVNEINNLIEIHLNLSNFISEHLTNEIRKIGFSSNQFLITNNSESYRLFLKGKFFHEKNTKADIYKAINYFQQSFSFDSTNVYSIVEIIECYFSLFFSDNLSHQRLLSKINPLISIVAQMDQNIDTLQSMLGGKKLYVDWKFKEAENHFLRALEINPMCLIARYRYSSYLILMGRFYDALFELEEIKKIDPLSVINLIRIGRIFFKLGKYEIAKTCFVEALEFSPQNYVALDLLGATELELGNTKEALRIFEESIEIEFNLETLSMIGYIYAIIGKIEKSIEILNQILVMSINTFNTELKVARIYIGLGNMNKAYEFLELALKKHDVDIISIKTNKTLMQLGNESRFQNILNKIGLP